jgi:hypothetical protein
MSIHLLFIIIINYINYIKVSNTTASPLVLLLDATQFHCLRNVPCMTRTFDTLPNNRLYSPLILT